MSISTIFPLAIVKPITAKCGIADALRDLEEPLGEFILPHTKERNISGEQKAAWGRLGEVVVGWGNFQTTPCLPAPPRPHLIDRTVVPAHQHYQVRLHEFLRGLQIYA